MTQVIGPSSPNRVAAWYWVIWKQAVRTAVLLVGLLNSDPWRFPCDMSAWSHKTGHGYNQMSIFKDIYKRHKGRTNKLQYFGCVFYNNSNKNTHGSISLSPSIKKVWKIPTVLRCQQLHPCSDSTLIMDLPGNRHKLSEKSQLIQWQLWFPSLMQVRMFKLGLW